MGARASSPAQGTLLAFRRTRCTVINTFMGWCGSLRYTECVFNGTFMKRCGFGGWGFPWELGEIYFAWHSLFELCARWTPSDFVLYIRRPGGVFSTFTSLGILQEFQVFSTFLNKKCRLNHGRCNWGKDECNAHDYDNTIAIADRARSLIILQVPSKNVQELAKEEREESETKLRGAIEISEGAVSAIAGSWRDS